MSLKKIYKQINADHFPKYMELSLFDDNMDKQTLQYEKVTWTIDGETKGLRYGENPCQEAALYKLLNGNLLIGDVTSIQAGQYVASDIELLQSGKHPGKTNITDADNALNILRYFTNQPAAIIVKHNNPSGVAIADSLDKAYHKALMADRIAAFGGALALNRSVDAVTAELIAQSYLEVIVAPDYDAQALAMLTKKKNLRIMRIQNIERLSDFIGKRFLEPKALMDGGMVLQWSYSPQILSTEDFLPAVCEYKGKTYATLREATEQEKCDMLFGWLVESGITSNSVIYVKDGATVGIGTGEQDRVGVAEIAKNKAYLKAWDRLAFERYGESWYTLNNAEKRKGIIHDVEQNSAGLVGAVMVSDAFFPFRDGVEVGLRDGVSAVIQPGGSLRDFEVIDACNEYNAAMVFTGQRSFKH